MLRQLFLKITSDRLTALIIIGVLTALAYSNTFRNDFIIDDTKFIVDWPLIADFNNFPQFFTSQSQPIGEEGVYSPLKTLFHSINYNMFGSNPFGYHFVALLIHLAGTFLSYKIAYQLTGKDSVAFLCGLFFGLHPIHVEAITFLTASIDTLGIIFLFACVYFYNEQEKSYAYSFSLIFGILAVFTHELAITLPLLILLSECCLKGKNFKEAVTKALPFFIVVGVYVILKAFVLGSITRGGYLYDSFYLTQLVSLKALAKYVFIMCLPLHLAINPELSKGIFSVDWQDFDKVSVLTQSVFEPQVLISILLTGFIIFLGVQLWHKEKVVSFCIFWFYICLLPVLNIIPSECYFAERYLYPGSFGFCLILAIYLDRLLDSESLRQQIAVFLIIAISVFYFGRTFLRNKDWKDEITFYKAEIKSNPNHPVMHRDLASIYIQLQEPQEALSLLKKADQIRPKDPLTLFLMGNAYSDLYMFDEAINSFKKAIDVDSTYADAYYNLSGVYAYLGNKMKAREFQKRAVYYYKEQGRGDEAEQFTKAFNEFLNNQSQ